VGSAVQGDRRVTFVISGIETEPDRAEESERIVNWAFRQFAEETLLEDTSVPVMEAEVFMGEDTSVALVPANSVTVVLPVSGRETVQGEVTFDGPLEAPVVVGQEVGTLTLRHPGVPDQIVPLVTASDVAPAGPWRRIQIAGAEVAGQVIGSALERFQ